MDYSSKLFEGNTEIDKFSAMHIKKQSMSFFLSNAGYITINLDVPSCIVDNNFLLWLKFVN